MTVQFQCQQDVSLPKLGWIAVADNAEKSLQILHGEYVELGANWLVEGVWDGRFQVGAFHRSEYFFGSGVILEDDKVIFVPSIAQMDRILLCQDKDHIIVSNSLLLLLAYTGASLDGDHNYVEESLSIALKGLSNYNRKFLVVHPQISYFYQIFQENIVVQNGEISFEPKARDAISFHTYEDYYGALLEKLKKIKLNYNSRHRRWQLMDYTTISSGYDSTAVSCLAKKIGLEECFTGRPLDGLLFKQPAEPSEKIGRKLGFNIHQLDSRQKNISQDELYFLAGNYPKHSKSVWSEISLHSMEKTIQRLQSPAIVFMGYCGDDVWGDKGDIDPDTGDLIHTPPISGSSLAEIRLHAGFLTISPAYMFLRNLTQIKNISSFREMDPWRLNNNYDRPIPRRIAEETGIPREWFGMEKNHITTTYFWPINKDNRTIFFRYIKKHLNVGRRNVAVAYLNKRILINMLGIKRFTNDIDFYDLMKKWATKVLAEKYSSILAKQTFLKKGTS